MAKGSAKNRPIIIRREEVSGGGHHGGAWKVAYADFMTAMMAFFLLMWLVNMTTVEQRTGLADYFSPSNAMSHGTSGFGAPFGGHTPYDKGSLASDRGGVQIMNVQTPPSIEVEDDDSDVPSRVETFHDNGLADQQTRRPQIKHPGGPMDRDAPKPADQIAAGQGPQPNMADAAQRAEQQRQDAQERAALGAAAQQIKDAVGKDPALADIAKQLVVDMTPEGLRIQLLDADRQAMFPTGSAAMSERARAVLLKIMPVLMKLPERLSIAGHTDSAPFRGNDRTNWELSADRANATRRLFAEAGLPEDRIATVTGQADRVPLVPADPMAAANRRIAITVLRGAPPAPTGH